MIDRRKVAMLLVLVGGALAAFASFQDTYRTTYPRLPGSETTSTTNLWVVTSGQVEFGPRLSYYAAGWPVVIASVLMVGAVVFMVRGGKVEAVARLVALAGASALAAVVVNYVLQLQREEDIVNAWPAEIEKSQQTYTIGLYLLIVAAVIGLAGAVLAQRHQEPHRQEKDEEEVVVRQLDSDDDTPPFGIAMLEQEREMR